MTTQQQMTRHRSRLNLRPMILALVSLGIGAQPFLAENLTTGSLAPSVTAARSVKRGSVKRGVEPQLEDLHPFTHIASIPESADPATIKLEKVKATKVFTKVKSTIDPGYCNELQFRDPGGSMYCPYTQDEWPAPAYEVTYSFTGQPLASDEYGNRSFKFQVYFRPEELPPALRRALSTGKMKRAELATYFNVAISRVPVRTVVIDDANSSLCDGNYVDGTWMRNDQNCQDKVRFTTVTMPPEYITVQVDLVSPRRQQASVSARGDHSSDPSARGNRR